MAKNVDQYIANFPPAVEEKLQQLRQIIHDIVPEAEEVISYGVVGYKLGGKPLVYFGGFKHHVSLFAAGSQLIAKKFAKELGGFIQSKGTIQFPLDRPLPTQLVRDIVTTRLQEVNSND